MNNAVSLFMHGKAVYHVHFKCLNCLPLIFLFLSTKNSIIKLLFFLDMKWCTLNGDTRYHSVLQSSEVSLMNDALDIIHITFGKKII